MKKTVYFIVLTLLSVMIQTSFAKGNICYSVEKIWDNGNYNSFTSLIKYKGKYYCTFREGKGHVFDENGNAEGKIRVICSTNGKKWESVLLISEDSVDLRDPKLSETPDGRLMVSIGCSVYRKKVFITSYPAVVFSSDGKTYSKLQRVSLEGQSEHNNDWAWRTTWYKGTGYTVNYFKDKQGIQGLWLMTTKDGLSYKKHCTLFVPNFPNEATVRFLSDGRMTMLVRRDAADCKGWWGISEAPYTDFKFQPMSFQTGGPEYMILNDTKAIVATRSYFTPNYKTILMTGNPQNGKFEEVLVLPSGGDTSYAGIIQVGNEIWVSYYSAHEWNKPQTKKSKKKEQKIKEQPKFHTSIYLAKISLSLFE